jgi:hypothetical protein
MPAGTEPLPRRALPWWVPAALWATLPLTAGPALAAALDGASGSLQVTAAAALWAGWLVALVAMLVRTTVSLTTLRVLAPAAPLVSLAASFAGASALEATAAVAVSVLACVAAFTADVGEAFVQGSAYGDEHRFPLKPPAPLLVLLPVAWSITAATLAAGVLLLAVGTWVVGLVLAPLGVALAVLLAPRLHRLSRRWLVLVPTGLVLHDPLVLADTAMFPRRQVRHVVLAPAGTEALDLTGGALGYAVEVALVEPGTVVLAGTVRDPQGKGMHVGSFLCSPSRPGRAVAAFAQRDGGDGGRGGVRP